jgi:RND family efflux transporter MFP subunit
MRKILSFGLPAVAVLGTMFWLGARFAILPGWLSGAGAILVRAAPVQLQRRAVSLRLSGKLSAETFEVRSRLAGRVTEVGFDVGDFAPPGAVVAIVESSQLAQTIADLQNELSATRETLKAKQERLNGAQKELEHSQDLARKNLIARSDVELAAAVLETMRADAELGEARAAQQEAMLDQARRLQKFTRLTTDAGGIVVARFVNPGATIGEGAPVLSIANMATLRLKEAIPREFVVAIKSGATVQISAGGTAERKIYPGQVVGLEQAEGNAEQSALIEIKVNARGAALKPEMVEALIDFEREAIWLPNAALVTENDHHHVYTLAGDRAQRREVALGITAGNEVEISAGLEKGDWVIVYPVNRLSTSARVTVQDSQPTANRSKRE